MNSFNNSFDIRIRKIKDTIQDIRGDLESLKNKNDSKNGGIISVLDTHNPNSIENTVDNQSERSISINKHNPSNNKKKNELDKEELNHYCTLSKNRERYVANEEYDSKTNELGISRSERNLFKIHNDRKIKENNISNRFHNDSKHNELSFLKNNFKIPRTASTNKIETNYNYEENSRNQFRNTNKTYSAHPYKFETNSRKTFERTQEPQEQYNFNSSYNSNKQTRKNDTKFNHQKDSILERSYVNEHQYDMSLAEGQEYQRHNYQEKEVTEERENLKNDNYMNYRYNKALDHISPSKDHNHKIIKEREDLHERFYKRDNSHEICSYSRNLKDHLYRDRNNNHEKNNLDTYNSHNHTDEDRKDSSKTHKKYYLSKTNSDNLHDKVSVPKTGFKIFETSKPNRNYVNLKIKRKQYIQSSKPFDKSYDDSKNDYLNKTKEQNSNNHEDQINELNSVIFDLKRKNAELQRHLIDVAEEKIPFNVKRQEIITLEKVDNQTDINKISPRFYHNAPNEKFLKNTENNLEYEYLLRKIREKLNVNKNEEILEEIDKIESANGNNKLRDNLIEKLTEIYVKQNNNVICDIKELWRWLKIILKSSLNSQDNKNTKRANKEIKDEYKDFCDKIIREFNLKDIKELKNYMNELMNKNVKNRSRVEKMKKLLLSDPTTKNSINEI